MGTPQPEIEAVLSSSQFRYLQGYMGTLEKFYNEYLDSNLDTFKDIWGPFTSCSIYLPLFLFRYLQGYMGT